MSKVSIYGLPNCDSTVAAIKWLEKKSIKATLHNYRTEGITEEKLAVWCRHLGWEKLLNKRSTTWRSLKKEQQDKVVDENSAIKAMIENTSLIKRPVIEYGNELMAGFEEKNLNNTFK